MTSRYEGRELLRRDLRQPADYFANRSVEATSNGWPHMASCSFFALCGQPLDAPHVERYAPGSDAQVMVEQSTQRIVFDRRRNRRAGVASQPASLWVRV
jgi:hypothetical protein